MTKSFFISRIVRQLTLRSQIGLTVGLMLIAILLAHSYLVFSAAREELKQSLSRQTEVLVNQLASELDEKIRLRIDTLESMSKTIRLDIGNKLDETERFFRNSPSLVILFDDLYLFSADGVLLVDWPVVPGRRGLDVSQREYIKSVINTGRTTVSQAILGQATKQPIIVIAVPIPKADGSLGGILGGVLNLQKSHLLDPLTNTKVGLTGYLHLIDATRTTILHPDRTRTLSPIAAEHSYPALERALTEGFEGTLEGVDAAGQPGLFSFRRLPHTDWLLAAVLPTDEAFATVHQLNARITFFTLLSLILVVGVIFFMLTRLTKPLEVLTNFLLFSRSLKAPPPLTHGCLETDRLAAAFTQFVAQQKRSGDELRVAATAFESQEGMFITSADCIILRVNHAFAAITGYLAEEIVGQTPDLLASDRHDAAFHAAMERALRQIGTWQGEVWKRRKNGEIYPEWLTVTAVRDGEGRLTHRVYTLIDITQRKAAEHEIQHLAFYDSLTSLPNRRLLADRLQQALASSSRSGRCGALLFIDLDNFKTLNDTVGHDKGDLLLLDVARRLTACTRESNTVARLGGDEFVVMLEELNADPSEAARQTETVCEKILAALGEPCDLDGYAYTTTASIGVALFGDHHSSVEELMRRADLAMYQAKSAGRNALRFFDPVMQTMVSARAALENDLRTAWRQGQFLLHYQPQVDSRGRVTGAEALLRWQHPVHGMVSPADFIPVTEETGLIVPLGLWVLETACAQLATWAQQPGKAHLMLAVNVSLRQFRQTDFVDQVKGVLTRSGARGDRLKLEITESLLLDNVEEIILKMSALKACGIAFSLDDFGTGYSSLSHLKRLPLDQLKIDQTFVRDLLTDANDEAIARTIVALARSLGLSVIAEGVETAEQRNSLAAQGCYAYQGYLYSRPLALADFDQLLDVL